MVKLKIVLIFVAVLILIVLLSNGFFGFFSGYTEKAQEFTSADYSIDQYKFFVDKYNKIRQMGSQIIIANDSVASFERMYSDPLNWDWKTREMYEGRIFVLNGYTQQYNKFVGDYNARMRDLTTNQMWMKPQNYPDNLPFYLPNSKIELERTLITLENTNELVIPRL